MKAGEMEKWLAERLPTLAQQWLRDVQDLGSCPDAWTATVADFVDLIAEALPAMIGPLRDEAEPVWIRTAELFGTSAAWRGLAAGEVVEETQLLRELVIRELYRDPPRRGRVPLSLRDVLRLNRAIDRMVTHASVGHTDAMFFQLFERGDAPPPEADPSHVVREVAEQLKALRAQLHEVTRATAVPAREAPR